MDDKQAIVSYLDDLVINNDMLPVRVSKQCLVRGKRNNTQECPGVLAIAEQLGDPLRREISVQVGHKTREHLSDRVVIKNVNEPESKWIGWISIPKGNGGFHPKRFDEGKQRLPGAMMIDGWSKESIEAMTPEAKHALHSAAARKRYDATRAKAPKNGAHRIFNG